jgi:DNA-binding CsgD family transcriptional regulator
MPKTKMKMISVEALSRLLHTLYGAPSYPGLWPQFLKEFVGIVGVKAAAILYQDEERLNYGLNAVTEFDPEEVRVYDQYYGKHDPWVPPIADIVPGRIEMGIELCPLDRRNIEYFHDFACKYDRNLFCAIPTMKKGNGVEAVTLYTGFQDEVPGKETLEVVKFMIPHLQTALHLRRRLVDLTARNCSMESALDLMEYGIVLLNDRGCVLQTNHSAEALLGKSDGLRLQDGHIECASRAESERLESLIEASVKAGNGRTLKAGGSMLVSRKTLRPLSVTAAPLRESAAPHFRQATAVLFLYDPESQPTPPSDLLRQAYGLTPAEARLALILTQGHSLKEAAHLCGVTHNTAKSQLKSIFTKTNVQRQAQLVRLVLSAPLLRQIS